MEKPSQLFPLNHKKSKCVVVDRAVMRGFVMKIILACMGPVVDRSMQLWCPYPAGVDAPVRDALLKHFGQCKLPNN